VNLQERLQVQVGHLLLVRHAEQLRERGVRQDAALERRVKARVRLHVLADELRHLRLRALLARLQAHEVAELVRQRTLDEEGVVRAASLPSLALLRGHRRRITALLLLGIAGLALRRLRGLLDGAHGIAHAGGELRAERLELLGERRQLRLRRGSHRLNSRAGHGRDRHRRLRGESGLGLLRGLGGLRGLRSGRRGDDGGGGGLGGRDLRGIGLLGGHLVV